MATSKTFDVEGFPELFKAMDELKEEIGKGKTDTIWRKSLSYAFEPVLQDAKSFAPEDTGQLEKHIYLKVQRPQARDKASASYRGEIYMASVRVSPKRDDAVLHTVLNKRGKFQKVWRGLRPVGISQEFGNARTSPHPFLRPALDNNIDNVISRLGHIIWSQINWTKNAKGKT